MPPRKAPAAKPPTRRLSTGDTVAASISDTFLFQRRQQIVTVRVESFTVRDDHQTDEDVFAELSELCATGMERVKGDHIEHKMDQRY